MAKAEREYVRLPGRGVKFEGLRLVAGVRKYSTLWLGKDHLLAIYSTGYTEEYKRFYYRDIQALITRKTNRRAVLNVLLSIPLLVCLVFLLIGVSNGALQRGAATGFEAFGGMAGFFLLLILGNALAGPRCICHIRTAVQTEELPSLKRLRSARKVLARLKAKIEQAQGRLTPEQIQSGMAQAPPRVREPVPGLIGPASGPVRVPRHYQGRAHAILFWLCLGDVPLLIVSLIHQSPWTDALNGLVVLATLLFGIVALIRQHDSDLPPGLRRVPWLLLGCLVGLFFISFSYGMVLVVQRLPEKVERLAIRDEPVLMGLSVVSAFIAAALGVIGLWLLRDFRRAHRPTRALASPAPERPSTPA